MQNVCRRLQLQSTPEVPLRLVVVLRSKLEPAKFRPDHCETLFAHRIGRQHRPALLQLSQRDCDPRLANPYGVIPVNPAKYPQVKYKQAKMFAEWLVSEKGQALIANYRLLDQPLFYPDAIPGAK